MGSLAISTVLSAKRSRWDAGMGCRMLVSFSNFVCILNISQRCSVHRAPLSISCTRTNKLFRVTTQVPSPWVLVCQPPEHAGIKNRFSYKTGDGKQEKPLSQAQTLCVAKLEVALRLVEEPDSPIIRFL